MERKAEQSWRTLPAVLAIWLSAAAVPAAEAPSVEWEKTFEFGPGDWYEAGQSVRQTPDGGYIVCGLTHFNQDPQSLLFETNGNGDEEWHKHYEPAALMELQITGDGGYVATGEVMGAGLFRLLKTDADGNVQWEKSLGPGPAWSVAPTTDGGYIVGGVVILLAPPNQAFLVKTDADGNGQWTKTYAETECMCVRQTADGGYILSGEDARTDPSHGFVTKTDANGNVQWSTPVVPSNLLASCQQTSDGGYAVFGETPPDRDFYLAKLDNNGNILWQKTHGGAGSDRGVSGHQTFDGGYVMTGGTTSFGQGDQDVYIVKTDANGNLEWQKAVGGLGHDMGHCIQETRDGGYVICGRYDGGALAYLIKLAGPGVPPLLTQHWRLYR